MDNSVTINLKKIENNCFVVMPFDPLFQAQYEHVIKPAVEQLGIVCVRGDEIYSKAQIVEDIWKSLRQVKVVIAELTGRNPNVMYEIGLAHAIGKPVILLTRNEEDVPFDLKALRYIFYSTSDPHWGDKLTATIREMIGKILKESDPGTYLEDIQIDIKRSTIIEASPNPIQQDQQQINITGTWRGNWQPKKHHTLYDGILLLSQDGSNLSGTLTVSSERDGQVSVVQQVISGSINGKTVNLHGVSYTFFQQGAVDYYNMDSFALFLNDNFQELNGQVFSEGSDKIVLTSFVSFNKN